MKPNPATYSGLPSGESKTFVYITNDSCTEDPEIHITSGSCSDLLDTSGRGTVSGVVIESLDGQKIVAIVNEAALTEKSKPARYKKL